MLTDGEHPRLYTTWVNMVHRCSERNVDRHPNWGGRGITVCDEWVNDFKKFYNWAMANGYQDYLQIDRIDNDGNYTPENCRWVTATQNLRNTRHNHNLSYNGEIHSITEWAEILGLHRKTIEYRIKKGKPIEEILKKK